MSLLVAFFAVAAASGAQTAIDPKVQASDPVVCRRTKVPDVGTRMKPKPVCMKKSDWAMADRQTSNELRQINSRGSNPGKAEGR